VISLGRLASNDVVPPVRLTVFVPLLFRAFFGFTDDAGGQPGLHDEMLGLLDADIEFLEDAVVLDTVTVLV